MKAPDFTLSDQYEKVHSLSDYKGRWVVLYFYPKDDTPGCTKEACGFRDAVEKFKEKNAVIFGVSKDAIKSHKKFADKFSLNFPLLSDPTLEVIKAYGAWGKKKFMGKEYEGILRNTYLISPEGEIDKTYEKVDPMLHINQILVDIK